MLTITSQAEHGKTLTVIILSTGSIRRRFQNQLAVQISLFALEMLQSIITNMLHKLDRMSNMTVRIKTIRRYIHIGAANHLMHAISLIPTCLRN